MLSSPVLVGLFLGQAGFLYRILSNPLPRREAISPERLPELTAEAIDQAGAALWSQIEKESRNERLAMARRALNGICDVSCDAVAEAFDLDKLSVRRLSSRLRRKGKQVTEVGTYTREQIWAAASEEVQW